MLFDHDAFGDSAAGIRDRDSQRDLFALEDLFGSFGLDRQERPGGLDAYRGFRLELHGRHAADFALIGRHQLDLDRHVLVGVQCSDLPDKSALRALRCLRLGVLQPRAAGNLVADFHARGGHLPGVADVNLEDRGTPDLDFRRGGLLNDQLRHLGSFKTLRARPAIAGGQLGAGRSGARRMRAGR